MSLVIGDDQFFVKLFQLVALFQQRHAVTQQQTQFAHFRKDFGLRFFVSDLSF